MDKQWMQNRLMDYLYNELDATEKQEVEQWLAANPEAQVELAAMQQTRGILATLPEAKPAKPLPVTSSPLRIRRRWLPTISAAAAAAILLLLIATNVRIQAYDGGMTIAFGKMQEPVEKENLKLSEEVIKKAIVANNRQFQQQLDSIQKDLKLQLLANQSTLQKGWKSSQKNYENELNTLADAAFQKKYPELAAFLQDMQLQQQQEMRYLLTELWQNWEQVRTEDLKTIERNFVMMNQNVELNRQGTEELFKNIMVRASAGE